MTDLGLLYSKLYNIKNTLHVTCNFCNFSAMSLLLIDYVYLGAKGAV